MKPLNEILNGIHLPTEQVRPSSSEQADRDLAWLAERKDAGQSSTFGSCGFPLTNADIKTLHSGSYTKTFAVEAVTAWAKSSHAPPVLVLFGGVGSGKTFASAVWAWNLARSSIATVEEARYAIESRRGNNPYQDYFDDSLHGESVGYFTPDSLSRRVLPWPNTPEFDMRPLSSESLVLDDVGTEQDKRFPAALFEVVNNHQDSRMIMTTNLTVREFHARYDMRVIDRLNACGKAVVVPGRSLRKKTGGFG